MLTAKEFWKRFCASLKEGAPEGFGEAWTLGMYRTLHLVQDNDFWCQCEKHGADRGPITLGQKGERMNIDFMWFPALTAKKEAWIAPEVAIEHENGYREGDRNVDHWKVSLLAVPLRVFIGYVGNAAEIETAARQLMDREGRWHAVEGGQSLIIMGHAEMEYACFRGWWSSQGKSDWNELHEAPGGCEHCR